MGGFWVAPFLLGSFILLFEYLLWLALGILYLDRGSGCASVFLFSTPFNTPLAVLLFFKPLSKAFIYRLL